MRTVAYLHGAKALRSGSATSHDADMEPIKELAAYFLTLSPEDRSEALMLMGALDPQAPERPRTKRTQAAPTPPVTYRTRRVSLI